MTAEQMSKNAIRIFRQRTHFNHKEIAQLALCNHSKVTSMSQGKATLTLEQFNNLADYLEMRSWEFLNLIEDGIE